VSAQQHAHERAAHRSAPARRRLRIAKTAALFSVLSVAATGLVVGGGVLVTSMPSSASTSTLAATHISSQAVTNDLADRDAGRISRSADRVPLDDLDKGSKLSAANASGPAKTHSVDLSSADPRTLTKALMPQFGMSPSDFGCIDSIWTQESGWNVHAANPTSSAYGIPQALPGSKMSSAGPDWQNNPVTQIKWGLGYIKERYGSACGAAAYKRSHGVY
jgi:hypothetical protein